MPPLTTPDEQIRTNWKSSSPHVINQFCMLIPFLVSQTRKGDNIINQINLHQSAFCINFFFLCRNLNSCDIAASSLSLFSPQPFHPRKLVHRLMFALSTIPERLLIVVQKRVGRHLPLNDHNPPMKANRHTTQRLTPSDKDNRQNVN